jgi:cytochrome c553
MLGQLLRRSAGPGGVGCCALAVAGYVVLGCAPAAYGQTAAPATPESPAVAAAPAAAAPATGLVGLVGSIFRSCDSCKAKCCNTPFGQLLDNAVKPFSAMTGGVIPQPCQAVNNDPSKQGGGQPGGGAGGGPPGPVAAASKIKKDQAQAKVRRQAVRYLGTVDCHYYPEAEAALITALRTDRSECVRWEAAIAFGNGCCCTKKTIQALTIVVSGSEKDGNPSETSPRVKMAAFNALQWCLACHGDVAVEPEKPEYPPPKPSHEPAAEPIPKPKPEPARPEYPDAVGAALPEDRTMVQLAGYYQQLGSKPMSRILAEARRALAEAQLASNQHSLSATGKRNLYDMWLAAAEPSPTPAAAEDGPALANRAESRKDRLVSQSLRALGQPTPAGPRRKKAAPSRGGGASLGSEPVSRPGATDGKNVDSSPDVRGGPKGLVQPKPRRVWLEGGGRPRRAPRFSGDRATGGAPGSAVEPAAWATFGDAMPGGPPRMGQDRAVEFSGDYADPARSGLFGTSDYGYPADGVQPSRRDGHANPAYDRTPHGQSPPASVAHRTAPRPTHSDTRRRSADDRLMRPIPARQPTNETYPVRRPSGGEFSRDRRNGPQADHRLGNTSSWPAGAPSGSYPDTSTYRPLPSISY